MIPCHARIRIQSWILSLLAIPIADPDPEGCLIKQVFVLDLIKVFVFNLNFLVNFNEDFIKVFVLDLN